MHCPSCRNREDNEADLRYVCVCDVHVRVCHVMCTCVQCTCVRVYVYSVVYNTDPLQVKMCGNLGEKL